MANAEKTWWPAGGRPQKRGTPSGRVHGAQAERQAALTQNECRAQRCWRVGKPTGSGTGGQAGAASRTAEGRCRRRMWVRGSGEWGRGGSENDVWGFERSRVGGRAHQDSRASQPLQPLGSRRGAHQQGGDGKRGGAQAAEQVDEVWRGGGRSSRSPQLASSSIPSGRPAAGGGSFTGVGGGSWGVDCAAPWLRPRSRLHGLPVASQGRHSRLHRRSQAGEGGAKSREQAAGDAAHAARGRSSGAGGIVRAQQLGARGASAPCHLWGAGGQQGCVGAVSSPAHVQRRRLPQACSVKPPRLAPSSPLPIGAPPQWRPPPCGGQCR